MNSLLSKSLHGFHKHRPCSVRHFDLLKAFTLPFSKGLLVVTSYLNVNNEFVSKPPKFQTFHLWAAERLFCWLFSQVTDGFQGGLVRSTHESLNSAATDVIQGSFYASASFLTHIREVFYFSLTCSFLNIHWQRHYTSPLLSGRPTVSSTQLTMS